MQEYHKIPTVWERDPETKYRTLIPWRWATREIGYLSDLLWVGTEKVDGTNIRVMWDGERVTFGGKTVNAQIPAFLVTRLLDMFPAESMAAAFDGPVCLYGEGYGAKIQKGGGNYIPGGVSFILFDVWCGCWLERENVRDIATKLGIAEVPQIMAGSLRDAIDLVSEGYASRVAQTERVAEGLVLRPVVELQDRMGRRIIAKVKMRDFAGEE